MSGFKPLPARPNLEFEHKAARKRLRAMRQANPEAKLADAQLAIAREYGFASWPKLVRYFEAAHRYINEHRLPNQPQYYEHEARVLPDQLRAGRHFATSSVASFVPRLYGLSPDELKRAQLTEDEARHVVVRREGFAGWQDMLDRSEELRQRRARREPPKSIDPRSIPHADDAGSLDTIISRHPGQLNEFLCGGMGMKPGTVRRLIERGADPEWVTPAGVPVLEHALLRYWNGEAVDVLAERVRRPRHALWIAAGLGDVEGVAKFLDANGRPTADARHIEPDFVAAGLGLMTHPEPGADEILMEAFFIACCNGRTSVIEYLAKRGFDVNTMIWESPMLNVAVGNAWTPVVASLLRSGADPDVRGRQPDASAREIASELFGQSREWQQRMWSILELLRLDPARILAERDARPAPEPIVVPELTECLELAGDDAAREGRQRIEPENLLWGMLRSDRSTGHRLFLRASGMEHVRFRRDHDTRLLASDDRIQRPALPLSDNSRSVLSTASGIARERRSDVLTSAHVLKALFRGEHGGYAPLLLARYGGSDDVLNHEFERAM